MDWVETVKTLGLPTAFCLLAIGGCGVLFKVFFAAFTKQVGDRINALENAQTAAVARIQDLEEDRATLLQKHLAQVIDLQQDHTKQVMNLQKYHADKIDNDSKKHSEILTRIQDTHTSALANLIDRVTKALNESTMASNRMAQALVQTLAALRSRQCMAERRVDGYEPHHTPLPDVDTDHITRRESSDTHKRETA